MFFLRIPLLVVATFFALLNALFGGLFDSVLESAPEQSTRRSMF